MVPVPREKVRETVSADVLREKARETVSADVLREKARETVSADVPREAARETASADVLREAARETVSRAETVTETAAVSPSAADSARREGPEHAGMTGMGFLHLW